MAACNGPCESFQPENEKVWFKIYESGFTNGTYQIGDQYVPWDIAFGAGWKQHSYTNNGWSVKIPENLRPGNYLIRHEVIMIELFPPQHYPECAHLTVTGDGDDFPDDDYLVSFPGAYSYDGEH